jgi:hypothetical protein
MTQFCLLININAILSHIPWSSKWPLSKTFTYQPKLCSAFSTCSVCMDTSRLYATVTVDRPSLNKARNKHGASYVMLLRYEFRQYSSSLRDTVACECEEEEEKRNRPSEQKRDARTHWLLLVRWHWRTRSWRLHRLRGAIQRAARETSFANRDLFYTFVSNQVTCKISGSQ